MIRRWRAFDPETINREMRALPYEDLSRLRYAMYHFGLDSGAGRDAASSSRCGMKGGMEVVTALLVYEKESARAPQRILDTARRRMRDSR